MIWLLGIGLFIVTWALFSLARSPIVYCSRCCPACLEGFTWDSHPHGPGKCLLCRREAA